AFPRSGGAHGPDQDAADFVLAGSTQDAGMALDARDTSMVRVIVRDGDEVGSGRQGRVAPTVTTLRARIRVGQDRDVATPQAKTSVAEPGEIQRLSLPCQRMCASFSGTVVNCTTALPRACKAGTFD